MMQNETLTVRFAPEDTALETSAKLAQIARDSFIPEKKKLHLRSIANVYCFVENLCEYAAANGHVDVVRLLLERDADVMVQTHDGKTALYWAQLMGRYDVSRLLLKHHGHGGPRKTIKKTRIKKQTRPRRPS